jgi:hypothetical protein
MALVTRAGTVRATEANNRSVTSGSVSSPLPFSFWVADTSSLPSLCSTLCRSLFKTATNLIWVRYVSRLYESAPQCETDRKRKGNRQAGNVGNVGSIGKRTPAMPPSRSPLPPPPPQFDPVVAGLENQILESRLKLNELEAREARATGLESQRLLREVSRQLDKEDDLRKGNPILSFVLQHTLPPFPSVV